MKNIFPGLLFVSGVLALMAGTDNHPPPVAAANTTAGEPSAVLDDTVPTLQPAVVSYTDGPTPLTEKEFADLRNLSMLKASNAIRERNGRPAQTLDERLCQAAQDQADYLARSGQLSHNVNGDPRIRAARHGFPSGDFNSVREIIAITDTRDGAFNNWCNSPGHYAEIIGPCDLCGFGMATGAAGNIWVGVYGRESAVLAETATRPYTQPIQQSASAGRWVTAQEPVYGPFGRQRGTQTVTRWEGPPRQQPLKYTEPQPFTSFGSCGPGGCSGRGIGRR